MSEQRPSNPKADALRKCVSELRRKPTALADLIPMLQGSADEIERLERELANACQWRDHYRASWLGPMAVPAVAPPDETTAVQPDSAAAMINRRVDKDLEGYSRAFAIRDQLLADEKAEEAGRFEWGTYCTLHGKAPWEDKCPKCRVALTPAAAETTCGHGKWTGLLLIPGVENCIYCGEARAALTPAAAEWPSETQSRDPFTGES